MSYYKRISSYPMKHVFYALLGKKQQNCKLLFKVYDTLPNMSNTILFG